ncbi:hypothetical protein GLOIN_2v1527137 [Rhizophagus irregularis DAOM 181602=DAOM 197198]|uniref:Uncharacterized protein n=1 Tax=Rhizophagus irregularis (strain DAOM 181602 / DAOM 197198 / MUCL 43194) TaxID=747089 RepID=A0A2P4QP78_RHIID|nr:hypothetical protein GLOIN_2v1527137 [Rhizophagus irregularis DAOM 181602=DAOM 197198]POG79368.1 hypothetical protein GLOIN_2v1527137 [Rhizophagus irregularis DAOM 181602=DAOM 197198]GET50881.1 hypothetical protein GLOIN_2v1527137 [Rhizophagus irregularis DAOM 181602=DAOM 197198]|eukprot:XP_025186234.1 hypothetical protein GLOIN_2v1527137 [Rhizophagus irregularis DAOM 181602=DAOM 197198]
MVLKAYYNLMVSSNNLLKINTCLYCVRYSNFLFIKSIINLIVRAMGLFLIDNNIILGKRCISNKRQSN